MKVAINALPIFPSRTESSEVYFENLVSALEGQPSSLDFVLIGHLNNKKWLEDLKSRFPKKIIPLPFSIWDRIAFEQLFLPAWLKKNHFDLFYSPQGNSLPLLSRRPCVMNVRYMINFVYPESVSRIKRLYFNPMMKASARKARMIICGSQSVKGEIVSHLQIPEEKVRVIYHGVPRHFTGEATENDAIFREQKIQKPYILAVGSPLPYKNLKRVLNAFIRLKTREDLPHKLVIIGKKEIQTTLQDILDAAPPALRKEVIFTGFTPNKFLPPFYRNADLFVFPSYCESFGNPALEAMASGIPLITSRIQAMPEIAGEAAYYVDPFSEDSIREGMKTVLFNPALKKKMIEKGRERVRLFTWKKTAVNTLEVLNSALG